MYFDLVYSPTEFPRLRADTLRRDHYTLHYLVQIIWGKKLPRTLQNSVSYGY